MAQTTLTWPGITHAPPHSLIIGWESPGSSLLETQYGSEMLYFFPGNTARHTGISRGNYSFMRKNRVNDGEK
jgi:hypothetical protein